MNREITKFYEKIFEDAAFREKLELKMKEVKSESELKELIKEEIIPIAQKMGKSFTVDDLMNFEKESMRISKAELENVGGGISLKPAILGGGLMVLSLFGAKINTADAAIPTDVITKYNLAQHPDDGKPQAVDEEYIMAALNPKDAEALNLSGTTERFRFFNGDVSKIAFGEKGGDGIPTLKYNEYSGKGSANLMTSLFPSSAGQLESTGGSENNYPLSKCDPTPQLMASMVAWLHNHVRTTNLDPAQRGNLFNFGLPEDDDDFRKIKTLITDGNVDELYEKLKEFRRKHGSSYNEAHKKGEDVDYLEKAATDYKELFDQIKSLGFNTGTMDDVNFAFTFLTKVKQIKDFGLDLDLINNAVSFKTILYILRNAQYMIENQEQNDVNKDRILPKYTTERMFMCYFIQQFNTQGDLNTFFEEVRKNLKGNAVPLTAKTNQHDDNMKKVLEMIKFAPNCPYKSRLSQNAAAKVITKGADWNLQFTNKTFQDCADITVGHFMNLMGYRDIVNADETKTPDWSFFLPAEDEATAAANRKLIENAINGVNGGVLNRVLSLKERLQAFIHYIREVGPDNTSLTTRSFWNLVVSHMDNSEKGYYEIKYTNGKETGNELETGYVNMLKTVYNLLHALGKDCTAARTEIDAIDVGTKDKAQLTAALKAIIQVFDPKATVELGKIRFGQEESGVRPDEIYGEVTIESNGKTFTIAQSAGHAYIDFDPNAVTKGKLESDQIEFIKTDPIAQLLAPKFGIKQSSADLNPDEVSFFNIFYGLGYNKEDFPASEGTSQHYENYCALKSVKNLQGEGANTLRVCYEINDSCMESNITYQDGAITEDLSKFIFNNYAFKSMNKLFGYNLNIEGEKLYIFAKENKLIGTDSTGNEWLCVDNGHGGVSILPFWSNAEECPENVVIPSSVNLNGKQVKVVGLSPYAFRNNDKINKVMFADDFNGDSFEIGDYAFYFCKKLTSFTIPKSVTSLTIGGDAFYDCKNLNGFTIPESVTSLKIGYLAFSGCKQLTSFTIPESVTSLTIGDLAFSGCNNLNSFTLPESVTSLTIGDFVFSYCNNLNSFTIPESVTSLTIGNDAFYDCKNLNSFTIPKSVTSLEIGDWAFYGCNNLNSFTILGSVESLTIGNWAFKHCEKLTRFTIPESVTSLTIGDFVFSGCKQLTSFTIPESVTSLEIDDDAFYGCSDRLKIRIPSTLKRDYGDKLNKQIAYYDLTYKPFERSLLSTATAQANHLADFLIGMNIVNNKEKADTVENIDDLKNDIAHIARQIAYKKDKKLVIDVDKVVPSIPEDTELILSGKWKYGYGVDSKDLRTILQVHCELNGADI